MKKWVIKKSHEEEFLNLKEFTVTGEGVTCTWTKNSDQALVFLDETIVKAIFEIINVENANIYVRENINTQGEINEKI